MIEAGGGIAGDEDVLVVPASWRRVLHQRHGGAPGPAATLKPGPWEDGELGATPADAATFALKVKPGYFDDLWVFVDTWAHRRGLAFAAAATLGLSDGASSSEAQIAALLRMRRLLAAANEADYAQAVAALGALRVDYTGRMVASYLAPTEAAWADEVLAESAIDGHSGAHRRILPYILGTPEQAARLGPATEVLHTNWTDFGMLASVGEGLGAAALPLLTALLDTDKYVSVEARRAAFAVIAQLPSDEAFETLASRLAEKFVPGAVREAMERFPRRALRLLARTANGGGPSAAAARKLLAGQVRNHPGLVEALSCGGELPERDAALISRLAREAAGRPEAGPEQLPALLRTPPWTVKGGAKQVEPAVVAGLEPPEVNRIDWAAGEREDWLAWSPLRGRPRDWESEAKSHAENGFHDERRHYARYGEEVTARDFLTHAPEELARPLLPRWQPEIQYWTSLVALLGPVLARFEQEALPTALTALGEASPAAAGPVLQPVVHPAVARTMADWFTRYKSARGYATAWFTRHAPDAALLLIPDAVGERGPRRVAAENALRFLAPLTDVRAAAVPYGPDAVAALEQALDFDPLDLHPRRMPAPPSWLAGANLPQILLRGREYALPVEAARHVLSMLAISKPGEPYAGIAVVRELADGTSLAAFVWEVFESWQAGDLPAKDTWVLTALSLFGDDDTARRLAPLIRAWPGDGGHQRAVAGLDVLTAIGTDVALMQLHQISQKVQFKGLKGRAQEKITEIARALDLTADQLADRLVPEFGLDEEGSLRLDYGPRRFRVGFDEQLRPFVIDESGTPRKILPPPNAKDDAELAAAARKHFGGLKKDVRTVADGLVRRLEAGMVAGRVWSAEEFRELLLGHPLVWHITRRLVWLGTEGNADTNAEVDGFGGVGDGGWAAFRVAEDRSLATVDDAPFVLAEGARVRLAHPIHLGAELTAWAELFADYEIVQPFPQLGRPIHALTEQERAGSELARFEGITVPVGRVLGLLKRGWQRGGPMDGGVANTISRELGAHLYAVVDLDPGIAVGYVEALGDQTLRKVYLARDTDGYLNRQRQDGPHLDLLDPVTASELIGDLIKTAN
ncbi:DUF4132 domain-containing protein [Actinospica durhamensis]|uniref:DUF4132 domain-containing protein n=1 Tax=Actinospica durhamensis TaxID=1508375 RepID=A0A941IV90_9ACTN|nr:DUF4132 domain-containing protein [Actinospica durhamensis]MBR7836681.1 DUF4132 domain-containing protein [Actinospica durhamensis]